MGVTTMKSRRGVAVVLAWAACAGCPDLTVGTDGGVDGGESSSGGNGNCGALTYYGECHGDTLRYCYEGEQREVDCAHHGLACGLQNSVVGNNCLDPGCASMPPGGQCASSTLFEYCTPSGVEQQDCAAANATCGQEGGETKCVTACGSMTYFGECQGNTLVYCQGGADREELVRVDCSQYGMTCQLQDQQVGYNCLSGAGCGDVPASGRCSGQRLDVCVGGAVQSVDCAAQGGSCQPQGGGAGCVGGTGGSRRASGRVTFDKRQVTQNGLGSAVATPARRVVVEVVSNADNSVLGFSTTDDQGRYQVTFDGAVSVRVRAVTRNTDPAYRIDVHDPSGYAFAVRSEDFTNTSAPVITADIGIPEQSNSGAFNIFDVMVRGFDFVRDVTGQQVPALEGEWQGGVTPPCGTSCYSSRNSRIYVLSSADDTDEFDDAVLLHEFGHFFEDKFSRADSPGGAHDGSPTDPRLAWGEGYGTWVGCTIAGTSLYIDTRSWGAGVTDLEDTGRAPNASPGNGLRQPVSEYLVAEVLWDISDGQNDRGDTLSAGAAPVLDVLSHYFPTGALQDRGVSGVDLVDFLDGWFCRGHGQQEAIRSIVNTTRGFPYDYAGPGNCR
jgi:hypothetical protein